MIHISHPWPGGRKQTIRKVSPVQTKRGAEQYERELRKQLVSGQWKEGAKKQQTPTLAEFEITRRGTPLQPGTVNQQLKVLGRMFRSLASGS